MPGLDRAKRVIVTALCLVLSAVSEFVPRAQPSLQTRRLATNLVAYHSWLHPDHLLTKQRVTVVAHTQIGVNKYPTFRERMLRAGDLGIGAKGQKAKHNPKADPRENIWCGASQRIPSIHVKPHESSHWFRCGLFVNAARKPGAHIHTNPAPFRNWSLRRQWSSTDFRVTEIGYLLKQ